jgi:hypothetical protein
MRPFWADPASSPKATRIHPALTSFADEVCATVARLFAYMGTLALIATLGVHFWGELPQLAADELQPGWSLAGRSSPVVQVRERSGDWITEAASPRLRGAL